MKAALCGALYPVFEGNGEDQAAAEEHDPEELGYQGVADEVK